MAIDIKLASTLNYALQPQTFIPQQPSPAVRPESMMPRRSQQVCGESGRKFLLFLIRAGKAEVALTAIRTWLCIPLPSGKINY